MRALASPTAAAVSAVLVDFGDGHRGRGNGNDRSGHDSSPGSPQPGVDYTDGHPLVAVDLDEQTGLRLAGTVVGTAPADITVGDRVLVVWRDIDGRPPRPDFEIVP